MDFGHPDNDEFNRFPDEEPILGIDVDEVESLEESVDDADDDKKTKTGKSPNKGKTSKKTISIKQEKKITLDKMTTAEDNIKKIME